MQDYDAGNIGRETSEGVGGAQPPSPIRVTDHLLPAHSLADFGRHIDPFSLPHWRYVEVFAWIVTRDLGVVSGARRSLDNGDGQSGDASGVVLISFVIEEEKPLKPGEYEAGMAALSGALARGELRARGRKNDGDLTDIPTEVWADGQFISHGSGAWMVGKYPGRERWNDLRFDHVDVQRVFPPESGRPPVSPPDSGQPWVPLTAALMWVAFNHAADIGRLNRPPLAMLGRSHEHVRGLLEREWRKLADMAGQGQLTVRGRRFDGSQSQGDEIELTRDDLLNCKWFDWAVGDPDVPIMATVHRFKPDDRVATDYSGVVNFSYVRVEREGLLRLWPVPAAMTSMGAALSQQMSPVTPAEFGSMVPLSEARNRVAATFLPLDTDSTPSAEAMATAAKVSDAITEHLRYLLKSGAVPAVVVKSDGSLWRIPSGYWGSFHDFRPLAGAGFFTEASHGALAHGLSDAGVFVGSADLVMSLSAGTVRAATTAGGVNRLKPWLETKLDGTSPDKSTRAEIAAEGGALFSVSANAFNTVWQTVTADGRSQWNRAGRKPRTPKV